MRTLREVIEELMHMECIKEMEKEDVYYFLYESGIPEYIFSQGNVTLTKQ